MNSNSTAVKLALRKQRLLIAGTSLRTDFAGHAVGLKPALAAADLVCEGGRWVRRNPQFAVAVAVALLVIRPSAAWRWTRRLFVGWQAWRRLQEFLELRRPS